MQLQTHLNSIRSQNLNEERLIKVKPCLAKQVGLNRLYSGLNTKAVAQILPLIIMAVVIVGLVGYVVFAQQKDQKTEPEVRTIIQKEIVVVQGSSDPQPKTEPTKTTSDVTQGTTNLAPMPIASDCREPSGVFTQLWVRKKNTLTLYNRNTAYAIGVFRYQGNCPTTIYVEAGVNNERGALLSLMPFITGTKAGQPSICDGNKHYNGAIFDNVQPDQEIKFELKPENYGVEGTYPVVIGAYTGCFKDGGAQIQALSTRIAFSDTYGSLTTDTSWENLVK